jgi:hypothetical protein
VSRWLLEGAFVATTDSTEGGLDMAFEELKAENLALRLRVATLERLVKAYEQIHNDQSRQIKELVCDLREYTQELEHPLTGGRAGDEADSSPASSKEQGILPFQRSAAKAR